MTKRQQELKEIEDKIKAILEEGDAMIIAKLQITEGGIMPYPVVVEAPVKEAEQTNQESN